MIRVLILRGLETEEQNYLTVKSKPASSMAAPMKEAIK